MGNNVAQNAYKFGFLFLEKYFNTVIQVRED